MMDEKNRKSLLKGIAELPLKEAPNIWEAIELKLEVNEEENKSILDDALKQLPQMEAPDIWIPVEAAIPKKKDLRSIWMVAASLVLFISSVFLFIQSSAEKEEPIISYSTESIESFNIALGLETLDTGEDAILSYIQKNCKRLALTCNDPEFKGLLEMYMELSDAKQDLVQKLEKKNQPHLMKYLIRIEKNQTEVGKDMLKKLRNS